jgi:hypothetical protein
MQFRSLVGPAIVRRSRSPPAKDGHGAVVEHAPEDRLIDLHALKGDGSAYGAPNLFKQFSKPFAKPHTFKFAASDLAIHSAFVLRRAIVVCSVIRR